VLTCTHRPGEMRAGQHGWCGPSHRCPARPRSAPHSTTWRPSGRALHEARKAYKKARYAVEVFAPGAGKSGKALVNALTDLQDVLGAHQDSVVARELLLELGPDSFWFGVLWARQEQVGKQTYAELPVVVEASRKKKLRRWLG